jgi:RNA polymerase sigma-B factor
VPRTKQGRPLSELPNSPRVHEVNTDHTRQEELALFREYHRTGDPELRDKIILQSQAIAVGLAKRFRERGAEMDDLVQVAQIGLMHAIDRFDPERGIPFIGFATPTVLGELRRHFRTVWSVKMPRSLQEATQRLRPALSELQHELGRVPTIDEVATRLGISSEQVLEAMDASSAFRIRSLDTPIRSEKSSGSLATTLADTNSGADFSQIEAREVVDRLLPTLSARSRQIIELRFFENKSQAEIADAVGISQMHVSRLLRQALETLGELYQPDDRSTQILP